MLLFLILKVKFRSDKSIIFITLLYIHLNTVGYLVNYSNIVNNNHKNVRFVIKTVVYRNQICHDGPYTILDRSPFLSLLLLFILLTSYTILLGTCSPRDSIVVHYFWGPLMLWISPVGLERVLKAVVSRWLPRILSCSSALTPPGQGPIHFPKRLLALTPMATRSVFLFSVYITESLANWCVRDRQAAWYGRLYGLLTQADRHCYFSCNSRCRLKARLTFR